jgi:Cu2+-exporting ATPase
MSNSCFHCGQAIPKGSDFTAMIQGQPREMCCPGCQAVAEMIAESGLDGFYKHRQSNLNTRPEISGKALPSELTDELALYDSSSVQTGFVTYPDPEQPSIKEAMLVIEGVTCAACVWLLEHHLKAQAGVESASVNLTNHRARVRWDDDKTTLSQLMKAIYQIGYQGHPYHPDKEEQILETEKKKAIRRLGVAGLGMMQSMMMAMALYAGALEGIEPVYEAFLRWTSLIIATPVVLYSARPFFIAALRDLKTRHLSMDIPVSLAIGAAYVASVWATVFQTGEVYYDSVTMFTFFLLIGRYLEMQARHRTGRAGNALLNLIPTSATRLNGECETLIPSTELTPGDLVLVKPGHTIPADGVLTEGHSSIDESALTGEYLPTRKQTGDTVVGGTINVENPIKVRITEVGADTRLSAIVRLLDRAQQQKPKVAQIADAVASRFVAAVLITAALVSTIWWQIEPANAFWITLSVLVVTCPCALSLATPTALTTATGTLRQQGLLITRGHVLESLSQATHIIFDKTGTLTEGNLSLSHAQPTGSITSEFALSIAGALEAQSEHPIAKAFKPFAKESATQIETTVGEGVEGVIQGKRYRIGKPVFASQLCEGILELDNAPDRSSQWLLLCSEEGPMAWFGLSDRIRSEAASTINTLHTLGLTVELLTGDHSPAVESVAQTLGIQHIHRNVSPKEKLDIVQQRQSEGANVIMVGDGINDIPVLAGAQTSIAMGGATDLAKTNADAVLISNDLTRLVEGIRLARKTRAIIRQNIAWALGYNVLVLPLAATGFIAPYMAAIGMSASSLVVVGNALRLSKTKPVHNTQPRSVAPLIEQTR